jgi:5'-nucleotidase
MAAGGDGFTVLTQGTDREVGPVDLDAFVSYVRNQPHPYSAQTEGRIVRL